MITVNKRTAKFTELSPYDYFAKADDFVEVTDWTNGEGFDVHISGRHSQVFSLTWGEWDALQAVVAYKE